MVLVNRADQREAAPLPSSGSLVQMVACRPVRLLLQRFCHGVTRHCTCPSHTGRIGHQLRRTGGRSHISDHRLTALTYMHMLDTNELRAAMPKPPQSLNLAYIDPSNRAAADAKSDVRLSVG